MLALVNPGSLTMVGLQSTTYETRTTMLALVMPGWLLRVGLMPLTCDVALAGVLHNAAPDVKDETNLARVPSLLSKFAYSGFLGRLALVDQAGGELDAEGFDGRAVLYDDHGADGLAGVLKNRHDGDGVNAGGLACLTCGGFPDALFAVLSVDWVSTWNMLVTRRCRCCCVPGQTTSMMLNTVQCRIQALSVTSIFLNSVHLASSALSGLTRLILGACGIVRVLAERMALVHVELR
jgi:hypothetical protein